MEELLGGAFGGATAAGISGGDPGLGALFGGLTGAALGFIGLGPDGSLFGEGSQTASSGFTQLASNTPGISVLDDGTVSMIFSRTATSLPGLESSISPFDFIGPGLVAGIAQGIRTAAASLIATGGLSLASNAGSGLARAGIIRMISKGESVPMLINEAKALTFTTGNEVAAVSLQGGGRALVMGGPGGIDLSGLAVRRILGHTHPYGLTGPVVPSPADLNTLKFLGQRHSYILERGVILRFNHP